jgi:hypothetical protein
LAAVDPCSPNGSSWSWFPRAMPQRPRTYHPGRTRRGGRRVRRVPSMSNLNAACDLTRYAASCSGVPCVSVSSLHTEQARPSLWTGPRN